MCPLLRFPGVNVLEWACVYRKFRKPIAPYPLFTGVIDHPETTKAITRALTYGHCGVHVYWSPFSAGKSTYLRHITPKLVGEGKLAGAILTEGGLSDVDVSEWMYQELGMWHMNNNLAVHLADLLQKHPCTTTMENKDPGAGGHIRKPYAIIIDGFDETMRTADQRVLQNLIVTLAGTGHRTKLFTVVLAVTQIDNARTVLSWNGRQKIDLIGPRPERFKWQRPEIVALAKELAETNANGRSTIISDELIDICSLGGTPGVVIDAHCEDPDIPALKNKVEKISAMWGRAEELHKLC